MEHSGLTIWFTGLPGSGKSTIIKLIMKEEAPTGGELYVNGIDTRDVDRYEVPVFRKKIGVVFQDYKLLQNKTAYQNIAFALRVTKTHGREHGYLDFLVVIP